MKYILLCLMFLLFACQSPENIAFDQGMQASRSGEYETALEKWLALAQQGHAEAQFNLGVMYENGLGVQKDHAQASKWFKKAAEQGLKEAQNNLGKNYAQGRGLEQDYIRAYKWLSLAAEQGLKEAAGNLDRITRHMNTEQINEARQLISH